MENLEKKIIIQGIFILAGLILLGRLYAVQVNDPEYRTEAESNVVRKVMVYPSRGLMFDRYGKLVVNNEPVFDLMVVPRQVKGIDTTKFCNLLGIDKEFFVSNTKRARRFSSYKASVFMPQIPLRLFTRFQEYMYQFPGFFPQIRTVRNYSRSCASHLLGYIGEVSKSQLDTSQYYQLGDFIGISGIERTYEEALRGQRGVKFSTVDVHNREKGSYKDGANDKPAIAGTDIQISIDLLLQEYGEQLMQNKIGSAVAIEPATGEILAMVSSPGYDPQLLSGRDRSKNYRMLELNKNKPLYNRAVQGQYPPGSTFKSFVALIGMQEGVISKYSSFHCGGSYRLGSRYLKCSHYHPDAPNIKVAIEQSCNPYFWQSFRKFIDAPKWGGPANGLQAFHDYLIRFGFGTDLYVDLPGIKKGIIPTVDLYDRLYKAGRWKSSNIISLGIGQGELAVTPLEMANFMAIIANRGYYISPHLLKYAPESAPPQYLEKKDSGIAPEHYESVVEGLRSVITNGTGRRAAIEDIEVCGKTGTAQNPHGDDHSVFVAFAPMYDPKIAIAVIVENGGYGSRYGGPIASLMIEKYLKREIRGKRRLALETKMFESDLINVPEEEEE